MTINLDLAAWGEPPATADEQSLGLFLQEVFNRLDEGQPPLDEVATRSTSPLWRRRRHMVDAMLLLYQCAASIHEYSFVEEAPAGRADPHATLGAGSFNPASAPEVLNAPTQVDDAPAAPGSALPDPFPGEFQVRRLLGEGAFGKVWLAEDVRLGRPVALKTLKVPAHSPQAARALAALEREARLMANLHHPNIVQVYAWRQDAQGENYLVLQYVPGRSFADRLREQARFDWRQAARYIVDVGEGLLQVHARGVIHRDIKLANILWDSEKDEALLTDFGLSRHLADVRSVAGTPWYMAQEAFDGKVTPSSDVYSLAVSLFHLITGQLPFPATTLKDLVQQVARGLPNPDPRCQGIPEPLERVLRQGLAARPEDRPALSSFVATLRGVLNQLLVDDLAPARPTPAQGAPVVLDLRVSRRADDGAYQPVAATRPPPDHLTRDLKKVPPRPEQVRLHTGDRIRIEAVADQPGYLAVFNVGPTGNLSLLHPELPGSAALAPAHHAVHVADVELAPPAGRERIVAVWSREPLHLPPGQLLSLMERGEVAASRPYRATRDMKRVKESVQQLAPGDWHAVVLELEHG